MHLGAHFTVVLCLGAHPGIGNLAAIEQTELGSADLAADDPYKFVPGFVPALALPLMKFDTTGVWRSGNIKLQVQVPPARYPSSLRKVLSKHPFSVMEQEASTPRHTQNLRTTSCSCMRCTDGSCLLLGACWHLPPSC